MYSNGYLCTVTQFIQQQHGAGDVVANVDEDRLIRQFILAATGFIEMYTGRWFLPLYAERLFDALGTHIAPRALRLDADLLEAVTVTNGDATVITSSQYALAPRNLWPKRRIELKTNAGVTWTFVDTWEEAISIEGFWGYHSAYDRAWVATLDTVQDAGGINASVTSLTVSDADGVDANWMTRFQLAQYIRIGDEVCMIIAINTTSNVLTILRGQLGSTAAIHANGAAITSYSPPADIEQCALSLAKYLYRNSPTEGDKLRILDGNILLVNEAPQHVKQTLEQYRVLEVG